jgi:hypothetical protein
MNRIIASAFIALIALAGCASEEPSDPSPGGEAPAGEGEASEAEPAATGTVTSALPTETRCAAGAVGDVRWANDLTCCTYGRQRQRYQRCDGRYWRNTASSRCTTLRCAT